jgi:hypothetical protein
LNRIKGTNPEICHKIETVLIISKFPGGIFLKKGHETKAPSGTSATQGLSGPTGINAKKGRGWTLSAIFTDGPSSLIP